LQPGCEVNERIISDELYDNKTQADRYDAIKMLVYRLRSKLGPQLCRRIKNKRNQGWSYLQSGKFPKRTHL